MFLSKKVVLDAKEMQRKSKSNWRKETALTIKTLKDKASIIHKKFRK